MRRGTLCALRIVLAVCAGTFGPHSIAGEPTQNVDHWSFQRISRVRVPDAGRQWAASPLDRFIARGHHEASIRPTSDAGRYTWLRRVTLDLTGLPPAVDAIRAFETDQRAGRRERAIDRLLASPAFGEKWARHWLDLACYADSIGSASMPMRHAWRYRDYVIDAFNADKSLDRFAREQIAGDELVAATPEQRREHLIATGFLAIGPWQLAEQDKEQLRMDIIDHQITRIGTTFLSMTLDCARCHDHKFDPITQSDYYAMAGLFANFAVLDGIWRSNVSAVVDVALPEFPDETAAREAASPGHADAYAKARRAWEAARDELIVAEKDAAALVGEDRREADQRVETMRKRVADAESAWRYLELHRPDVPRAHAVVGRADIQDMRINIAGDPHALGDTVKRGFVRVIAPATQPVGEGSSGRRELVDWLFNENNPLTARVLVNRVWFQLFGRGLVDALDYFGQGSGATRPQHTELLDFLARDLQRRDWSLKSFVRSIVLSRTYGLATETEPTGQSSDPENRLYWRANPRRLDAEMIRDGMLHVTDELIVSGGGPAIDLTKETVYAGDLVNPPTLRGGFPISESAGCRRSIYLPAIRSYFHTSAAPLELFDAPSPNHIVGQRVTTTVPTQALFLMNGPFVKSRGAALARIVLRSPGRSNEERLEDVWWRALGRPITDRERRGALKWLDEVPDTATWEQLCHAVLASNEFLFRR